MSRPAGHWLHGRGHPGRSLPDHDPIVALNRRRSLYSRSVRNQVIDACIRIPELAGLDLEATVFGGQTFRWKRGVDGWAIGWIGPHPVRARSCADGLNVAPRGAALTPQLESATRRYFDADRDYAGLRARLLRDARLREAAEGLEGLRILRQPAFETVIGFIVSANNNIPRISKCLDALCRLAGEPVVVDGVEERKFPVAASLAGLDVAVARTEANLGYRDRYVVETSERIASGAADLERWHSFETPELVSGLQTLPGVGPKVADCIALFAYGRFDVFPVDTWIRQAYASVYPVRGGVASNRRIAELARRRFGSAAGLAQQYLFESTRRKAGLKSTAESERATRRAGRD